MGNDLLIVQSGIGSFLIEVIAPMIIHLWIVGDLKCSPSRALEVLVDQRAGDYGRLILNSELMEQQAATRADVPEKHSQQMEEGPRSGHLITEGEQSCSLTQPRRVTPESEEVFEVGGRTYFFTTIQLDGIQFLTLDVNVEGMLILRKQVLIDS